MAIDTETLEDGSAWSVQFSVAPGTGYTIRVESTEAINYLRWFLSAENPNPPLTIIHNELFDRPVAEELDFEFARTADTMIMAYLLQAEPQGLKPLAFRHCGMEMMSYEDMIAEAGTQKSIDYLEEILKHEWPDPDQVLEFKKDGTPHIKQPQNVAKKVKRILADFKKGKALPWIRWHNIDAEEGRGMVEEKLGKMPQGTIQDVWEQDPDRAVWYASRDPDATIRVYPYLWERIQALGLEETFWIDMGCIQMASDMQKAGILPDLEKFKELSARFGKKMLNLQAEISKIACKPLNPGSWQQVQWLLYTCLGLKSPKQKKSTDDKTLARLKDKHRVVPMIREYRSYSKLKGTYADELPKKAAESADGRIHTTIRLTRTGTGRLCVDPNTLVEAPRDMEKYPSGIPLYKLQPGDWVYSFDHTRELCLKRVKWVGATKMSPTLRILYAAQGEPQQELLISPDHLVGIWNKNHRMWKHAADLRVGERLLCMPKRHDHGQGYYAFFPHSRNRGNGQIETKTGKKGQSLKESTIVTYKRRVRRMERGIYGRNHTIIAIKQGPEMQLWDLEIEDTHCFIGNEVALHNSSANPNLMNQPTRTEDGKEIKKSFIAAPGCRFCSADYSGIEMRVAAHVSQDPFMLQVFREGRDLHSETASAVFGIPVDQVDKMKHRYPCKRVGFGILYGITASGLREQLLIAGLDEKEWTIQRTQELIDEWFGVYKGVEAFMYDTELEARRRGYVRDMWGRIRYVPGVRAADEKIQAEAVRQAGNQPIQCLPGHTKIRTKFGYQRIDSFDHGDVWTGSEWAYAQQIKKGYGQIVKIHISDGAVFECDTCHRVLVSNRAWPEWKWVTDLKKGDILAQGAATDKDGLVIEDAAFWYWVGRYYGDGYFVHRKRGDLNENTGRHVTDTRYYVEWAFGGVKMDEAQQCFSFLESRGYAPKIEHQYKKKSHVIRVRSYKFDKRMLELGIAPNKIAYTKRIADVVFLLIKDFKKSFIQGYYDADGKRPAKYTKGYAPKQITSVNHGLLQDTLLLLRSVGKDGYIKGPYRQNVDGHKPFYRLCLTDKLLARIVDKIEITEREEPVFTLCVAHKHHAFDSEGVISHNSGAQGIIKKAMGELTPIYKQFQREGYYIKPIIQIHDDLLFEVEEKLVPIWVPLQKSIMESVVQLSVPVTVDAETGYRWGEMKKYEEWTV